MLVCGVVADALLMLNRYESTIVQIYQRRKAKFKQEAEKNDTATRWSEEEELDLNRYQMRQLYRQSQGDALNTADKEKLYSLRCELIEKLAHRAEQRVAQEQKRCAQKEQLVDSQQLEPEPELPELEGAARHDKTARKVSFSVDIIPTHSPRGGRPSDRVTVSPFHPRIHMPGIFQILVMAPVLKLACHGHGAGRERRYAS
eukprot:COSAG01_NODE_2282_length_8004_cov_3.883491_6_plen_201_part_00